MTRAWSRCSRPSASAAATWCQVWSRAWASLSCAYATRRSTPVRGAIQSATVRQPESAATSPAAATRAQAQPLRRPASRQAVLRTWRGRSDAAWCNQSTAHSATAPDPSPPQPRLLPIGAQPTAAREPRSRCASAGVVGARLIARCARCSTTGGRARCSTTGATARPAVGRVVVSTDRSLRSLLDHRWARSLLDHRGYGSITGGASGGLDYPRLGGRAVETRYSTTGNGSTTGAPRRRPRSSVVAACLRTGRRR